MLEMPLFQDPTPSTSLVRTPDDLAILATCGTAMAGRRPRHLTDYSVMSFLDSTLQWQVACMGKQFSLDDVIYRHALPAPLYDADMITRRSFYIHAMRTLIARAEGRVLAQLLWEWRGWLDDDADALKRAIRPHIHDDEVLDANAHWYWYDYTGVPTRTGAAPVVSYQGRANVSVLRLLWTRTDRNEYLRLNKAFRPRHKAYDSEYHCINPFHYDRAEPMRIAPRQPGGQRGRRGRRALGTSYALIWHRDSVQTNQFGLILCADCGGELGAADQLAYQTGKESRQGYCPNCYAQYLAEHGKIPRNPDAPATRQALSIFKAVDNFVRDQAHYDEMTAQLPPLSPPLKPAERELTGNDLIYYNMLLEDDGYEVAERMKARTLGYGDFTPLDNDGDDGVD